MQQMRSSLGVARGLGAAKEGVGLEEAQDGRAYRMGYFLGDGTGAGKGGKASNPSRPAI